MKLNIPKIIRQSRITSTSDSLADLETLCGVRMTFQQSHISRFISPWFSLDKLPDSALFLFAQRDRSGIIASTKAKLQKTRCSDALNSVGLIPSACATNLVKLA